MPKVAPKFSPENVAYLLSYCLGNTFYFCTVSRPEMSAAIWAPFWARNPSAMYTLKVHAWLRQAGGQWTLSGPILPELLPVGAVSAAPAHLYFDVVLKSQEWVPEMGCASSAPLEQRMIKARRESSRSALSERKL